MDQQNFKRPRINEKSGLFILIALMGAGFVLGGGLTIFLWQLMTGLGTAQMQNAMTDPAFASEVRAIQTLLSVFIFLIPALITSRIMSNKPMEYLGLAAPLSWKVTGIAVLIMLVSIVLGGSLATLNEMIPLTDTMKIYFRGMEDDYMRQVDVMSQMKGPADLAVSLAVMALIPAIVEECFFRGGFQNMMYRSTNQVWVSVIITALLFSAIHFSFYGFLTRTALGIILGMIYIYGRSLWLPILAHFINNAIGVGQVYYLRMKGEDISSVMDDKYPLWWGAIAVAGLYFLFSLYVKAVRSEGTND